MKTQTIKGNKRAWEFGPTAKRYKVTTDGQFHPRPRSYIAADNEQAAVDHFRQLHGVPDEVPVLTTALPD